ncbi:MAG: hypothetical protein LBT97_10175, partial [Planctomycetota bacterium]|nr:hypothetical protein [Planctomycetota bacterium]
NDPEFVKAMNRVGAGSGHPPGFGFVLMRFFTDKGGQRAVVITETQSDTMSLLFDPAKEESAKESMGEERVEELRKLLAPVKKTWAKTLFRNAIRQLTQSGKVDRIYAITPDGLDDLADNPPQSVVKDTIGEKSARAEGFGDEVTLEIDGEEVPAWGAIEVNSPSWNELAFQGGLSARRGRRTAGRRARNTDRLATAQGIFDGKTVHLIAENLSPDEAAGTLLHEFWHKALKAMGLNKHPAYEKLMTRLERIEKLANSPTGRGGKVEEWFRKAADRLPESDRGDREKRLNELAAYAITEYETAPRSLPQTIKKWVEDFLAAIRAFFIDKTGRVPENLTAADLSAIARRFLQAEAKTAGRAEGRAQPLTARVLTPSGYRLMSEIHVGDEVTAADGSATKVEAVYPQGVQPIYRITLSDGSSARSTADHLWKVREVRKAEYEMLPLETIMRRIRAGRRYAIPQFAMPL